VIKVFDAENKTVIQRRNGESYLIDYGAGLASLREYENKMALINSPGLFAGAGSIIILPNSNQSARILDARPVDDSMTPIQPDLRENPGIENGNGNGLRIQKVLERGRIIQLRDNSLWEVSPVDVVHTFNWRPTSNIVIVDGTDPAYPQRFVNQNEKEAVDVRPIGQ
jgi:hypothetical protein